MYASSKGSGKSMQLVRLTWVKVFRIIPKNQDFEADFPQKVSLKILNSSDYLYLYMYGVGPILVYTLREREREFSCV